MALDRECGGRGRGTLGECPGGARRPRAEEPPLRGIRGLRARRQREAARRSRGPLIAAAVGGGALVVLGLLWLLCSGGGGGGGGKNAKPSTASAGSASRDVAVVSLPASYTDDSVGRLVRRLGAGDLGSRIDAAKGLAALGPRAHEAVPALLNATARSSNEIEFASALGKAMKGIGGAALPALVRALRSDVAQARFHAASALAQIGRDAAPAMNVLVEAMEGDPDYSVRANAATALGAIGPAAASALSALRRVAGNPNEKFTQDTQRDNLRVCARLAMMKIRGGQGN